MLQTQQQTTKFLQCLACLEPYDLQDNLPRLLPYCGHTLCHRCVSCTLENSVPKCPFDQKKLSPVNNNEEFPINSLARGQLEASKNWQICQKKHGVNKAEGENSNGKYNLCLHCIFFSGHADHLLKLINEIKSDISSKKDQIQGGVADMNQANKIVNNMLDERRLFLSKKINDSFQGLVSLIKTKKQRLLLDINSFFDQEREQLNTETARDYNLGVSNPNFCAMSFVEESHNNAQPAQSDFGHEMMIKRFDPSLASATKSFAETLNNQIDMINRLEDSNRAFAEKFKKIYKEMTGIENPEDFSPKPLSDIKLKPFHFGGNISENTDKSTNCLKVESSFMEIKYVSKCLSILATNKPAKTTSIDLGKWRETERLIFRIENFKLNEQDLETLSLILKSLENVKTIEIFNGNQHNLLESELNGLLSVLFNKPQNLLNLTLDFVVSQVGDQTLYFLAEKVFSNMQNLQKLSLNLIGTKVSNYGMQSLGRCLEHVAQNLVTCELYLSRLGVSEESLVQLFVPMPKVKHFQLDIGRTLISDEGMEIFVNNTLSSMKTLESFLMWLDHSKVEDDALKKVIMGLVSVNTLKNFDVFLDGTGVSEALKMRIAEINPLSAERINIETLVKFLLPLFIFLSFCH